MQRPHSTHAHSTASTAPRDQYSEVVTVHVRTPALSPWLPGYIDVVQTILVILTIVGIFPDLYFWIEFVHFYVFCFLHFRKCKDLMNK